MSEENRKNGKPEKETMTPDEVETMLVGGFDKFLGFVSKEFGMQSTLKDGGKPTEAYLATILQGITQLLGSNRYIIMSNRARDDRINAKLDSIFGLMEGEEVPHPGNYMDREGKA
ncbi:hypothetical protein IIA15_00275 [candidate division TA06 bacterium]|nr:hypothetical protein [candidate division TA06 bacterium]